MVSPILIGPTPAGVPVKIKSPGSRRIIELKYDIMRGIGKIISRVLPFWRNSSLTLHQISTPLGLVNEDAGM